MRQARVHVDVIRGVRAEQSAVEVARQAFEKQGIAYGPKGMPRAPSRTWFDEATQEYVIEQGERE
jgi:hypothetical protein